MKKFTLFFLFSLIASTFGIKAQNIQDGVLISWPMASGDIKIPDGVVEIAPNCFHETSGEWGGGEDEWGGAPAFGISRRSSNEEITSVDFNQVKKIGKEAFKECKGIKSVKMPNVEEIGEDAFASCDNNGFTTLEMPAIKRIGKNAFFSCSSLQKIVLGGVLEKIEKNPFNNDPNITEFKITNAQAAYVVADGTVLSKDKAEAVIILPQFAKITLPDETTTIADGAAQNVKTLQTIIGKSVTTIGESSFLSADALESIYLPKLENVGFLSFSQIGGIKLVDIHESTQFTAFSNYNNGGPADKTSLTIYVANETVKTALEQYYKKAKIIVGAPASELKKYRVNFKVEPEGSGFIEAWTTGPVTVENGGEVAEGSTLKMECRYKFTTYEFSHWTVNGNRVDGDPQNAKVLEIKSVDQDLNIVAYCNKLPEGNRIFFKSATPAGGTVTAVMDGKEIKSSEIVPTGKSVTFTATPVKGYNVTDWLFEDRDGKYVEKNELKGKTTWTITPTETLDFLVRFERNEGSVVINYEELSGNGSISARTAEGAPVASGEAIASGKDIIFMALPKTGYKVGTWIVNDEERTEKDQELRINNVTSDLSVRLVCEVSGHQEDDHAPVIAGDTLVKWNAVGDVVVPNNVKHIADFAFKGSSLTGLTISAQVESIGELPFMFCGQLKKLVVVPENQHFTSVDNAVYTKDGKELIQVATAYQKETFSLPASVEKVRTGAFTFAIPIKKILGGNDYFETVDGMLIRKADRALMHYPSFVQPGQEPKPIELPNDIKKIEKYAFAFNFLPQKLVLPADVEVLEDYAFIGAANLVDLKIEHCQVLKRIGDFCFKACFRLASFNLPQEGVTYIGEQALQGSAIVTLNVPKDATIGANAFRGCQSIAKVYSYSTTPPALDDLAFSDIADIEAATLYVPQGAKEAYSQAPGWKTFTNIEEFEVLSVTNAALDNVHCSTQGEMLNISGLNNARILVYSTEGKKLAEKKAHNSISFSLAHGSYIVVVSQGRKQIVKKIVL